MAAAATRPPGPRGRRGTRLAVLVLAAAVLGLHASHYLPFLSDDALISLRYAERLVAGQGLTWNDGERVEGYSNLLWVLACAALGALGLDLIDATRVLGGLGMLAALAALLHGARLRRPRDALPALAASLGVALSGPIAIWTVGGLEQPLVAGLLAWALATSLPLAESEEAAVPAGAAACFALLCWTRPDGPLFVAAAAGALVALGGGRRAAWRRGLALALPAALFVAAQLVFRLAYYGDWLPNTWYARAGLSPGRVLEGLRYLGVGLAALAPLALPAVGALVLARGGDARARRVLYLAAPLALWCLYVVLVGGDVFPGRRHLVPAVVLLAFLAREAWAAWCERSRHPARVWAAAGASLALLAGLQLHADPAHTRALRERWEWDGEVVGRLLRRAFGEARPLLATDSAGTLPYFSGLPSLDMLGLNDRWLAHHPPADLGEGPLAHELGDGAYVLRREPDLVIFCDPAGGSLPCHRSSLELARSPEFHRRYRLVAFVGEEPYPYRSLLWVRTASPRIGIRREAGAVVVPGFVLGDERSEARLDETGRLGLALPAGRPARSPAFALAPGRWRLDAEARGALRFRVLRAGTNEVLARGAPGASFALAGEEPVAVELELRAAGAPAHLRRLRLERARPGLSPPSPPDPPPGA